MSCSLFFYRHRLQHFVVCARKMRKRATHTSALSRARSARPPGRHDSSDPMASASTRTSELAIQSPAPTSSLAKPPPAASPYLGRWICQQGLRSARIRGLLLLLLRRVLLPLYVWSYFVPAWYFLPGSKCVRVSYMDYHTALYVSSLLLYPAGVCGLAFF